MTIFIALWKKRKFTQLETGPERTTSQRACLSMWHASKIKMLGREFWELDSACAESSLFSLCSLPVGRG